MVGLLDWKGFAKKWSWFNGDTITTIVATVAIAIVAETGRNK
jgi:hypothetical protein